MARFTCTNCGYSIDNVHPREEELSCPGCRHRLETDGEQDGEIQEQDQFFFEELMSGETGEQFVFDEPAPEPEQEQIADVRHAAVHAGPRQYKPVFDGSAAAYFRVWIVNVLFSVLTIGIFMVRGKKRVRNYFLNTIVIDSHPLVSVTDHENIYEHIMGFYPGRARSGSYTVECSAKALKIFWIRFSNMLAVIFSLGLLIPWAKVRRVRYLISTITIISDRKIL